MSADNLAQTLWLAAKRDEVIVTVLVSSDMAPLEGICFHVQQFLEKLLKCALSLRDVVFPHTHDLVTLTDLLTEAGGSVPVTSDDLDRLAPCAVLARYEELSTADIERAQLLDIMATAQRWAEELRKEYSLP